MALLLRNKLPWDICLKIQECVKENYRDSRATKIESILYDIIMFDTNENDAIEYERIGLLQILEISELLHEMTLLERKVSNVLLNHIYHCLLVFEYSMLDVNAHEFAEFKNSALFDKIYLTLQEFRAVI